MQKEPFRIWFSVGGRRLIADKGYDADWFIACADGEGVEEIVIPPRANRKEQRDYDKGWYKKRNLVERTINRLKEFRKIALRTEKTALSFSGICYLAAITINLKLNVNTA